jgi:hypothetical protein
MNIFLQLGNTLAKAHTMYGCAWEWHMDRCRLHLILFIVAFAVIKLCQAEVRQNGVDVYDAHDKVCAF